MTVGYSRYENKSKTIQKFLLHFWKNQVSTVTKKIFNETCFLENEKLWMQKCYSIFCYSTKCYFVFIFAHPVNYSFLFSSELLKFKYKIQVINFGTQFSWKRRLKWKNFILYFRLVFLHNITSFLYHQIGNTLYII